MAYSTVSVCYQHDPGAQLISYQVSRNVSIHPCHVGHGSAGVIDWNEQIHMVHGAVEATLAQLALSRVTSYQRVSASERRSATLHRVLPKPNDGHSCAGPFHTAHPSLPVAPSCHKYTWAVPMERNRATTPFSGPGLCAPGRRIRNTCRHSSRCNISIDSHFTYHSSTLPSPFHPARSL